MMNFAVGDSQAQASAGRGWPRRADHLWCASLLSADLDLLDADYPLEAFLEAASSGAPLLLPLHSTNLPVELVAEPPVDSALVVKDLDLPDARVQLDLVNLPVKDSPQETSLTVDSGFQSSTSTSSSCIGSHSRSSSESDDIWTEHSVLPSTNLQSLGINPLFNIWSPSTEDEAILKWDWQTDSSAPPCPSSSSSSVDGSSSPPPVCWDSDTFDWDTCFKTWNPVPSPSEAEMLLEVQRKEEEEVHQRAAVKRAVKKAMFFARINQKRRNHLRI